MTRIFITAKNWHNAGRLWSALEELPHYGHKINVKDWGCEPPADYVEAHDRWIQVGHDETEWNVPENIYHLPVDATDMELLACANYAGLTGARECLDRAVVTWKQE